jgi:hypothetical protein
MSYHFYHATFAMPITVIIPAMVVIVANRTLRMCVCVSASFHVVTCPLVRGQYIVVHHCALEQTLNLQHCSSHIYALGTQRAAISSFTTLHNSSGQHSTANCQ